MMFLHEYVHGRERVVVADATRKMVAAESDDPAKTLAHS
jgi:hypothetical protein